MRVRRTSQSIGSPRALKLYFLPPTLWLMYFPIDRLTESTETGHSSKRCYSRTPSQSIGSPRALKQDNHRRGREPPLFPIDRLTESTETEPPVRHIPHIVLPNRS